jgi:hypothetical protein
MRSSRFFHADRMMSTSYYERHFGFVLEPCPFCGAEVVALYMGPDPHVVCTCCGSEGPPIAGDRASLLERQSQAGRLWNKRA